MAGFRSSQVFIRWAATFCCLLLFSTACSVDQTTEPKKRIGVIYIVHGGNQQFSVRATWESVIKIFSYDPNTTVYQRLLWNKNIWPMLLKAGNAPKELGKYSFEFERIGGTDPFDDSLYYQLDSMTKALEQQEQTLGVDFITDWMGWIAEFPEHLPNPRGIYYPPNEQGSKMTYCGEGLDDGPWTDCDPERFNVDGSVERMLKQGVDEIMLIDMTTSGVRFYKTFDVIKTTRKLVADFNQQNNRNIQVHWVNDPNDLMARSYPTAPANWTKSLGKPEQDPKVPLEGNPNPVAYSPELAAMMVDGIEASFNKTVAAADTAVMMINHTIPYFAEYFDPKVNDTLVMNENIKQELLRRYPDMKPENIVGSWMGQKLYNNNIKPPKRERTREMRGEALGRPFLYETERETPQGEWKYRYWEALELLKNQGAKHIVIIFNQIFSHSVLDLVEVPNQMAKEIGYKNWLYFDDLDFETYPQKGHPFADYWGIWVDKQCRSLTDPKMKEPCCFDMGGCPNTQQAYPPARQTPFDKARDDLDPSLAYDVSEYGHLGYDPKRGPVNPNKPVQEQYSGTWAMWQPPHKDSRIGPFLAKQVIDNYLSRQQAD